MLGTIAEANTLCYHAQSHFQKASSLAAGGPYHRAESSAQRNEPLIDALREAHFGSDKLQKYFSLVRENLFLVQNQPVLASQVDATQAVSISSEDLRKLHARSAIMFANGNNDHASQRELLKHCRSVLEFVHRWEQISGHHLKLLEDVIAQIRDENSPVVALGHPMGEREERSYHSSDHDYYHHHYHPHHHAMPEPYDVPLRAEGTTRLNRIMFNQNSRQQFPTGGAGAGQRYHYDPPPSSVVHDRTFIPNPKLEEEFEPLLLDEVMILSLKEEYLAPIIPDEIFTNFKIIRNHRGRQQDIDSFHFPEDAVIVRTDTNSATPTATTTASRSRSPVAEAPKTRRTRSGEFMGKKRRRRRPKTRSPKRQKAITITQNDSSDDMLLALALGGRMDFMETCNGLGKGGRVQHSGYDIGMGNTDTDSDDSPLEFPFDHDPPKCWR